MKYCVLVSAGLLGIACFWIASARCEERTWTAAAGGFATQAEFVELKAGGIVTLRLKDGSLRDVPLEKLSAADRQYVESKTSPHESNSKDGSSANAAGNSVAVTLADLKNLEIESQRAKSAREAAQLYAVLLAKPNLPPEVKIAADEKLRYWQGMADKNMVRIGKKWIPRDEYVATRKQANEMIKHALELIRLSQDKLAYDALVDASKLDPDSIQADFIIAVVFAIAAKKYDKANQHFENCLRRDPDNMAVLNNLALTEIKLGQVRDAINHWKAAVALGHDQRVAQNIGRLLDQAGKRRVALPKTTVDQLSKIYASMLVDRTVRGADKKHGWQYMLIAEEEPENEAAVVDRPFASSVGAFASGFVIAGQYLLTNRHVARDAIGFDIVDPARPTDPPLPASLVAVSDGADLAILKCDLLTARPVSLDPRPLRRGTDVMLLGYPDPTRLGAGLKSTRGSISALPSKELGGLCLYDAVTNPGNSGGPVSDIQGNVVAIHCAGFNTASRYGGGIPMETALPFIQKTLPSVNLGSAGTKPLNWPDIDELVSKSTVLILVKMKVQDVGLASRVGGEFLEDRSCNLCFGSGNTKCALRKCARGTVPGVELVVIGRTRQGAPIYGDNPIRVRCPNCAGKGMVRCTLCKGTGKDPDF